MSRYLAVCCLFVCVAALSGCCSRCGGNLGCGRSYWGAYGDDPPTCEPCDHCGNWTGGCYECGRGRFSRGNSSGGRLQAVRSKAGSRMACRCGRCRSGVVRAESGHCDCEQGELMQEDLHAPTVPTMHNVGYTQSAGFSATRFAPASTRAGCNCNH